MRAYLSIIKIRFKLLIQYRTAAVAGIFTQFFFGMVRVMVFYAFYSMAPDRTSLTYIQAITYIWIGQAMLGMLPWNGDSEIQNLIRTGNVSYELLRPINLYNQWFCRAFALRTAPTILRAIPIFIIALFLLPKQYGMMFPSTLGAFVGWIITTFGALMISCAITNIINICTLWSISGDGIVRLLSAVVSFSSGMIVPLPLFPDWLKNILKVLPFGGLVDIPIRLYIQDIPIAELHRYFIFQMVWAGLLYGFGRWLLNRKLKGIVVQGG